MDARLWRRITGTAARVAASVCVAGLAGLATAGPVSAVGGIAPTPDGSRGAGIVATAVDAPASPWSTLRRGHAPGTMRAV